MLLAPQLDTLHARWRRLAARLESPEAAAQGDYASIVREHGRLSRLMEPWEAHRAAEADQAAARALFAEAGSDGDLRALAKEEEAAAVVRAAAAYAQVEDLVATGGSDAQRDAILEIRAGTGGDEACLFAGDLVRLYTMWCTRHGLSVSVVSSTPGEQGGAKEVVLSVTGTTKDVSGPFVGLGAFGLLRYESGGHRVQRVPATEASGRIHTSAATVAVMGEVEAAEVELKADDLEITTQKSGGAGGQHVNKTESAIRILHKPSGLAVLCQQERSQQANKARAMDWLRARLFAAEQERLARERALSRKEQVGSGDRSDRIRTYNIPQSRCTDHRVDFTTHALDRVLDGDLDDVFAALVSDDRARRLAEWDGTW
jgi:peptide chain release factor 1